MQFKKLKIPIATLSISIAIALVYVIFSTKSAFMSQESIYSLGLIAFKFQNIFSYIFAHVGIIHLISNLIPLILFGSILESSREVKARDIFIIFTISGVIAGALFTLFNPSIMLIGASAAISGIIGAAAILQPKKTIICALALPLLPLVIIPTIEQSINQSIAVAESQTKELQQQVEELTAENKTEDAIATNETIQQIQEFQQKQEQGIAREKATPSDLMVHVYGLILGAVYAHFRFKANSKAR